MITSDGVSLGVSCLVGVALGVFFFGGLLWTIRRGLASRTPALWFAGSLALRTAVALGGFALVGRGSWLHLSVCLLGFVVGRVIVTRRLRERFERVPGEG